jgi:hypothetical protein
MNRSDRLRPSLARVSPQTRCDHRKSLILLRLRPLASVSPQLAPDVAKSLILRRLSVAPDLPSYYVRGGGLDGPSLLELAEGD